VVTDYLNIIQVNSVLQSFTQITHEGVEWIHLTEDLPH